MSSLATLAALSLLGYHLTFDAEMSSPSDMSQFVNSYANGNTTVPSNHEGENYVGYDPTNPSMPYSFINGALVITATPTPSNGLPYSSGMLTTTGCFSQSGGYFEIRAETPAKHGFWPAFWLLPAAYYPEIDLLEQPNIESTDTQYWTHLTTPEDSSGGFIDTGVNVSRGYHRYGLLWTPTSIQFVFDGKIVSDPHPVPASLVRLQMFMVANLAVGGPGSWPGIPEAGASSTYSIDYIRAYSNDPTIPAVSQEPTSSPDGADTLPVLTAAPPATRVAQGSGLDTLLLQVSEDPYQGDAQFTVSIDGHQRGGVLTAKAIHGSGQTQAFAFKGNFGTAKHAVTVDFINDTHDSFGDRNLYVTGATLDGAPIQGATLTEQTAGPQSFGFSGRPVQPISIGSGPDVLVLDVSDIPRPASARFSIAVDGVAQGSAQVAAALHAYGQTQPIAVHGNFGPASHTVALNFLNGAVQGGTSDPVDVYVDNVTFNGVAVAQSQGAFTTRGTYTLQTPAGGTDTLSVSLTEDDWQGDAQAEISMDGQVLGTTTVTAQNWQPGAQVMTYTGNWGGAAVPHTIRVTYLNDFFTSEGLDRNLYVRGITLDGAAVTTQPMAIKRQGPVDFSYIAPAGATAWARAAP